MANGELPLGHDLPHSPGAWSLNGPATLDTLNLHLANYFAKMHIQLITTEWGTLSRGSRMHGNIGFKLLEHNVAVVKALVLSPAYLLSTLI